ncbi:hypothetical protein VTN77DRAFT_6502 [Rasamsonia byssochlamydoides]|uniref:uncharacterized protein n=1 Tax=Rasamsonia byssochlamydoides TaxID=89139 RepID=UPI0037430B7E
MNVSLLKRAAELKLRSPTTYEQQYLLGFRGLLVIEAFLWVFLQTFVPVAVYASADRNGQLYQQIIRKTLSVLFWNEYLLYGAIVFLSARSIAIPFIKSPTPDRIARSVMCRGITLWFPVAVSLAIAKLAFSPANLELIADFKNGTGNNSLQVPYLIPNAFAYFNSVFDVFWTTHGYQTQAASMAFPSQTLWIITTVYMQSYTVYMTMVIIPFTRKKWRVQWSVPFILTAWWCQSWAWFTISGLILCDMVMNMDFKARAQRGIPIPIFRRADGSAFRLPVWVPAGLCLIGGLAMQYIWTAWRPDLFDSEYLVHGGLYYSGGLNYEYPTRHNQARDDAYLTIVGIFLFLESYDMVQRFFESRFLVSLGKRSLSYFLIQSNMIYIVGIRVFTQLRREGLSFAGSTVVTLITCLAVTIPAAEAFYRLVELPSKVLAHRFYDFITS